MDVPPYIPPPVHDNEWSHQSAADGRASTSRLLLTGASLLLLIGGIRILLREQTIPMFFLGVAFVIAGIPLPWIAGRRVWRALVGAHRLWRNRCENCGYPLSSVTIGCCPECGHPILPPIR